MKAPPRFLVCGSSSRGARPSSNSLASALPMRPSIQCRLPVTRGARRRPSARSTAVGPGGVRPRTRRPSGLVASVRVLGGRRGAAVASAAGPGPRRRARSGGSSVAGAPPDALPVGPTAPRRPRWGSSSPAAPGGVRPHAWRPSGRGRCSAAALSTRSAARVERRFGRRRALRPASGRPDGSLRPRGGSPLPAAPTGSARSAAVGTRPSRRPLIALLSCLVMHGKNTGVLFPVGVVDTVD